ncbi:MAG: hypothetical protein AAGI22_06765 [Planctomycetota bacterium]
MKLRTLLLLALAPMLFFQVAPALVAAPVPQDDGGWPEPPITNTVMVVILNGEMVDADFKFLEDGTWELSMGALELWGFWEYDPETQMIDYTNETNDGGGGQSGQYTWNEASSTWDRTFSSHPDAPELSLLPIM